MSSMPYTPSPYSSIAHASMVQSQPLYQALGPMTQMQQGGGGNFGPSPFAYLPPPPTMSSPVYGGGAFGGMPGGLMHSGAGALGTLNPMRPANWIANPPAVYNPAAQTAAMMSFPSQVAGFGVGGAMGAARIAGGVAATSLMGTAAMNIWRGGGLGNAASALGGGFRGAFQANTMFGAGASLARGGLGAIGALAAPAALPLAGLAGLAGAGALMGYAGQGVSNLQGTYRGVNDILGNFAGLPGAGPTGRGIGYGQAAGITQLLQSTGSQAFRRFDQASENLQNLAASGELTTGARSAQDMKRNLLKAFDTMGELMEVMNTTFDEAGKMFENIRRMGITDRSSMLSYAMKARVGGGVAGVGTEQMLQMGAAGAAQARGMGGYGAGGSALTMGLTEAFGGALRSGSLSNQMMRELTGGSLDPTQAAQAVSGNMMQFMQGKGQYLVAGLFDRSGNINRERLNAVMSGQMGVQDVISRGVANTASNPAFYTANRQRLTSQLFEQAGSDVMGLFYQQARSSAALTGNASDEMTQMMLMTQMGLTEAQARAVMQSGNPEAIRANQRARAASQDSMIGETLRTRQTSIGAAFERQFMSPLRQFGTSTFLNPMTRIGGAIGGMGEDFLRGFYGLSAAQAGQYGDMYSQNVIGDLQSNTYLRLGARMDRVMARPAEAQLAQDISDYSRGYRWEDVQGYGDGSLGAFSSWAGRTFGGRGDIGATGYSEGTFSRAMLMGGKDIEGLASIFGGAQERLRTELISAGPADQLRQVEAVRDVMGGRGNVTDTLERYFKNYQDQMEGSTALLEEQNKKLDKQLRLTEDEMRSSNRNRIMAERLVQANIGAETQANLEIRATAQQAGGTPGLFGFGTGGRGLFGAALGMGGMAGSPLEQVMDAAVRGSMTAEGVFSNVMNRATQGMVLGGGIGAAVSGGVLSVPTALLSAGVGGVIGAGESLLNYVTGADNAQVDALSALGGNVGGALGGLFAEGRSTGAGAEGMAKLVRRGLAGKNADEIQKQLLNLAGGNEKIQGQLREGISALANGEDSPDWKKFKADNPGLAKGLEFTLRKQASGTQASDKEMLRYASGAAQSIQAYMAATGGDVSDVFSATSAMGDLASGADISAYRGQGTALALEAQEKMGGLISDVIAGGITAEEAKGADILGITQAGADQFVSELGRLSGLYGKKGGRATADAELAKFARRAGISRYKTGASGQKVETSEFIALRNQVKSGRGTFGDLRQLYGEMVERGAGGADGTAGGAVDVSGLGDVVTGLKEALEPFKDALGSGFAVQEDTTGAANENPSGSPRKFIMVPAG